MKQENYKNYCNYSTTLNQYFSWRRLWALIIKEFIQLKRDRTTFAIIIFIPLMQLILFGYAINTDPKYLPTVVINSDNSVFTRAFIAGLENTQYFRITDRNLKNEAEGKEMLAAGKTQFVVTFPLNFTRDLLRGDKPQLLIEADATDPVATAAALAAVKTLAAKIFNPLLQGNPQLAPNYRDVVKIGAPLPNVVNVVTHANYNPENINRYNIVPGLLGVVLTMTMTIIASHCITREHEQGTIEHLLATPIKPLEVLIGKIVPYVILGYIQVFLIIIVSKLLFQIPIYGSVLLLIILALPFIGANLAVGLTFSSISKTQLQAGQMAIFFFLPSLLLSGFMFPFRGMPEWAQLVGNLLPLTYFLRIVRGIMLKGNGIAEVLPQLWPIMLFMLVAIGIGLKSFKKTLD